MNFIVDNYHSEVLYWIWKTFSFRPTGKILIWLLWWLPFTIFSKKNSLDTRAWKYQILSFCTIYQFFTGILKSDFLDLFCSIFNIAWGSSFRRMSFNKKLNYFLQNIRQIKQCHIDLRKWEIFMLLHLVSFQRWLKIWKTTKIFVVQWGKTPTLACVILKNN